nr:MULTISPECIES: glycosyltransferase family 1 protein [Halomonas]
MTGIGRYTYELAKGLQESEDLESLKLFSGTRFMDHLPVPSHESTSSHGLKRLIQRSGTAMELYRRLMPLIRAYSLRGHEDFIYHGPNFSLPPFPGRKVATIHDLSAFKWPETQDPIKVRYLQKELGKTLDSADALITPSEFIRRELAEFAAWPLEKIHAVPLAAGPEFRPRGEEELQPFLKRHGLSYQGYTLFVGTIEPRKNLESLLDAYRQLPKAVRQRWPLVLSGYWGWQSDDIHARIKDAEREGWAKYLGFLPAQDLPLLYSGARLFAFPSLYEGFGLPILEAMQSGVPVVCSDAASLPEVAGDAALCQKVEDVPGLADGVRSVLEEQVLRNRLISDGSARSECFSWAECIAGTRMAYHATQP